MIFAFLIPLDLMLRSKYSFRSPCKSSSNSGLQYQLSRRVAQAGGDMFPRSPILSSVSVGLLLFILQHFSRVGTGNFQCLRANHYKSNRAHAKESRKEFKKTNRHVIGDILKYQLIKQQIGEWQCDGG